MSNSLSNTGRKQSMFLDLTEGSVVKVQLRFCLPILFANLLQTAYNIVDMAIVGRLLDVNALSAVSIVSDIMLLLNLACNGLGSGAQILISQYTGKKNQEAVKKTIGTLLTTFMVMALLLTVLMILCAKPLLRFMNTHSACWDDAVIYSITSYCGIFAIFCYGVLGSMLRGMGDSKRPLLFVCVSSILNVGLDLLFIIVFKWGVFGAAFATVFSQGVSFVWAIYYLYHRKEQFGFDFKPASFKPASEILGPFFKISLPICLQNAMMQGVTLYINSFIYAYGVAAAAVTGVGGKLSSILLIITNSLVRSGASMVGQNISAQKTDRVAKVFWFNLFAGATCATLYAFITIVFREHVFRIFTTDAATLELTAIYLPALIIKYYGFACRAPSLGLINGIGRPKLNLIIAILDTLVFRAGMSLTLGIVFNMGIQGFWLGTAIGGFTPFFVGLPYFLSGKWKKARLVTEKQ